MPFIQYNFPNLVPCLTSTYTIERNIFGQSNTLLSNMTQVYRQGMKVTPPNDTNTYAVVLNFDTTDVVVAEEIKLITLPDFISSVGGNLGLFIGFACLPVLLKITEVVRNLLSRPR